MKGTIRERTNKDGTVSFLCQVFAGRDPGSGKRQYLTATASSRREANRTLHQLVESAGKGEGLGRGDVTLAELVTEWLATGGPSGENTRATYEGYIRLHVVPHLGKVPIRKLRVEHLERWYVTLREKGLAPASIRKAHNIVRGALAQGVRWGWIPTNVAAHAQPPRVPKPVIRTPSAADVARLVDEVRVADPEFAVYLRLAAVTGARPGELCALRWSDLATSSGDLTIRRRVIRAHGEVIVKDLTKTGTTRIVPLDRGSLDVLEAHRIEQARRFAAVGATFRDPFVFSDAFDGTVPWRTDSTSRRFRAARLAAGIGAVSLYAVRHQAATTLIDHGVDPKTVSERLGNSVVTVLSTYTRARRDADRSAADLMGSLLDGGS